MGNKKKDLQISNLPTFDYKRTMSAFYSSLMEKYLNFQESLSSIIEIFVPSRRKSDRRLGVEVRICHMQSMK